MSQHDLVLNKIPTVEHYLSSMLNNVDIVRHSHRPTILADDYLVQIRKLIASLHDFGIDHRNAARIHADLTQVQVIVEWYVEMKQWLFSVT